VPALFWRTHCDVLGVCSPPLTPSPPVRLLNLTASCPCDPSLLPPLRKLRPRSSSRWLPAAIPTGQRPQPSRYLMPRLAASPLLLPCTLALPELSLVGAALAGAPCHCGTHLVTVECTLSLWTAPWRCGTHTFLAEAPLVLVVLPLLWPFFFLQAYYGQAGQAPPGYYPAAAPQPLPQHQGPRLTLHVGRAGTPLASPSLPLQHLTAPDST